LMIFFSCFSFLLFKSKIWFSCSKMYAE
jgi:hypothetical protein